MSLSSIAWNLLFAVISAVIGLLLSLNWAWTLVSLILTFTCGCTLVLAATFRNRWKSLVNTETAAVHLKRELESANISLAASVQENNNLRAALSQNTMGDTLESLARLERAGYLERIQRTANMEFGQRRFLIHKYFLNNGHLAETPADWVLGFANLPEALARMGTMIEYQIETAQGIVIGEANVVQHPNTNESVVIPRYAFSETDMDQLRQLASIPGGRSADHCLRPKPSLGLPLESRQIDIFLELASQMRELFNELK